MPKTFKTKVPRFSRLVPLVPTSWTVNFDPWPLTLDLILFQVELFTFVESRQSYTRHKAIKDLEKPDFDVDEEKPCIWLVPAKPPPPFPPNPIRKRIEFPGTSKIIGCDRCEGVCRIPCVNCGGAGHKDCWNCNGDGVVKNSRTGIGLI